MFTQKDVTLTIRAVRVAQPSLDDAWYVAGRGHLPEKALEEALAANLAATLPFVGPLDTVQITIRVTSD